MKLVEYLKSVQITAADFGRMVGASRSAVIRWANGERSPDSKSMARIVRVTQGRVTPNDFFRIRARAQARSLSQSKAAPQDRDVA